MHTPFFVAAPIVLGLYHITNAFTGHSYIAVHDDFGNIVTWNCNYAVLAD